MRSLLLLTFLILNVNVTQAAISAFIVESGSDVFLSYSGTLDLTDLTLTSSASTNGGVFEILSSAIFGGPSLTNVDPYLGITGPTTFFSASSASFVDVLSGTGDIFGIIAGNGLTTPGLYVPVGYTNSALSGSGTIAGQSLSSLNLVPGIYTWTWGSGGTADSVTLTVGTPIPEPGTYAAIFGLLSVGLVWYRRKQVVEV